MLEEMVLGKDWVILESVKDPPVSIFHEGVDVRPTTGPYYVAHCGYRGSAITTRMVAERDLPDGIEEYFLAEFVFKPTWCIVCHNSE